MVFDEVKTLALMSLLEVKEIEELDVVFGEFSYINQMSRMSTIHCCGCHLGERAAAVVKALARDLPLAMYI